MNVRIRFPEPLHEQIKDLARRDLRSLNSEVLALIQEAIDARGPSGRKDNSSYTYPEPSEHRATGRLLRAAENRPPLPDTRQAPGA